MMGEYGVSTNPPDTDQFVWYREDVVKVALQTALESAVRTHGSKAKAFAWDVRSYFTNWLLNREDTRP